MTVADDVAPPAPAKKSKKSAVKEAPAPPPKALSSKHKDDDNSIDDVDEDRIDEILRDASKNLVIFLCKLL